VRELRFDELRLLERAFALRERIWRDLLGPSWTARDDDHARHFVALDNDTVIGVARLRLHGRVALLDHLATDPARRGQGVARCLDTVRLFAIDREPGVEALVRVVEPAGWERVHALERRGFQLLARGFDVPAEGHRWLPMRRPPRM
jgi:GNAT superfamily N-acetyltransferase